MFVSLTSRIIAVGTLVVGVLLLVGGALFDASRQSRKSFEWVSHSSSVIQAMDKTIAGVRDAESGLRGYVLTHNPRFSMSFDASVEESLSAFAQLVEMTADNPLQADRLKNFGQLLNERIELAKQHRALAQDGRFDDAAVAIADGRGLDLMASVLLASDQFLAEERRLQAQRTRAMEERVVWGQRLSLYGLPLVGLLTLVMSYVLVRNIRRPVTVIGEAMDHLGAGDLNSRIGKSLGSREFDRLARGYNAMADRLADTNAQRRAGELELTTVHAELLTKTQILKERGGVIELLGGMAHRMQAARTDKEMAQIITAYVPQVLPNMAGVLYVHNNSRNLLVPLTSWGEFAGEVPTFKPEPFAPDACWALRRGQSHFIAHGGKDIRCGHVEEDRVYHCEPLLAAGEVIGVLYLDGSVDAESRFCLNMLVENIASALVNHQLQRDLKEQTIRDALTGLFNRRYMEEALALETARSLRSGQPLSVVMCDVDHFKRFNDEHGHDAGDLVLQAVGAELANRFRDGDIVCRYGGEEFVVIAPGTTPSDLLRRLEVAREAITALRLAKNDKALGNLSMSFGVAAWKGDGDKDRNGQWALKAADAALYQAKREGRNRVILADTSLAA